jgi:hypothetical protein
MLKLCLLGRRILSSARGQPFPYSPYPVAAILLRAVHKVSEFLGATC